MRKGGLPPLASGAPTKGSRDAFAGEPKVRVASGERDPKFRRDRGHLVAVRERYEHLPVSGLDLLKDPQFVGCDDRGDRLWDGARGQLGGIHHRNRPAVAILPTRARWAHWTTSPRGVRAA